MNKQIIELLRNFTSMKNAISIHQQFSIIKMPVKLAIPMRKKSKVLFIKLTEILLNW